MALRLRTSIFLASILLLLYFFIWWDSRPFYGTRAGHAVDVLKSGGGADNTRVQGALGDGETSLVSESSAVGYEAGVSVSKGVETASANTAVPSALAGGGTLPEQFERDYDALGL